VAFVTGRTTSWKAGCCFAVLGVVCSATALLAQQSAPVTLQVDIVRNVAARQTKDNSNVVIWLTSADEFGDPVQPARTVAPRQAPVVIQRNKTFEPHVLVIPVGTTVQFPNRDPFFHNVFSLFNGRRFDLGLYEGGASNSAHFDHTGISFLFCNIHPEMSAAVVVLNTPYYALSDRAGRVAIPGVPDGHYRLHTWYERSTPEELRKLEREIVISSASRTLEPLHVVDTGNPMLAHKNKYNQDYTPVTNPSYTRP
jgi:plastocyanin